MARWPHIPGTWVDGLGRRFPLPDAAPPAEPPTAVAPASSESLQAVDDLLSLTRSELQRLAREAGHAVSRSNTKADLVELLTGGD